MGNFCRTELQQRATTTSERCAVVNDIYDLVEMLNILLGNFVSWKSCGCYFGTCSKHYYRPSTPIAMAFPAAGYILQNTKPQILRNGFRNATKNTRCWSSLYTPLEESTYNVRVENTTEPHCPHLSMQVTQKCVVLILWHFFWLSESCLHH